MAAFILMGCNDWLDVMPQGEARADDILSNTAGVNSAVAGVYYHLIQDGLQGKDLSYGALDAMAQYYTVDKTSHQDYYLVQFDYREKKTQERIDGWWKDYYVAIGQCNQILEGMEEHQSNIEEYELFEGELLALRAYIHMQLYQLFGPVVQSEGDLEQKAIPYRKVFDNVATPFLSAKEVLNNIKTDLTAALELLDKDPIKTGFKRNNFNATDISYNNILDYRVGRMNYYAVMGMLMRVNQLLLNQSEGDGAFYWANRIVTEVEDSESGIVLVEESDVAGSNEGGRDLLYSSEMIFSLYHNDLWQRAGKTFGMPSFQSHTDSSYTINQADFTNLVDYVYGREPDGAGGDFRLKTWFNQNSGTSLFPFQKYRKPDDQGTTYDISYPEIAVLRLSEVYYALCEAKVGVDNLKALEYLNTLRSHRGLAELEASEAGNVDIYLMRERRKEFMGDGRTFLINKRLFKAIEASSALTVQASKQIFELPIPEDEFTYGPEDKSNQND
jgi:hypothetical protein